MAEGLDIDVRLDLPGFRFEARAEIPLQGITALTGPSGSGKTTLLRLIAGLEPGASGRIRCAGADWLGGARPVPPAQRRIGMVFQDVRLFGHLTVAGNIAYGARRAGVPADRVAALVRSLDLTALRDRPVADLSGGEAHRVALARALARDPALLLLDEPLAGFDADRRASAMAMLARVVAETGVPALYVSHNADEVAGLADRVLGVERGRVTGWQAAPLILRGMLERDGDAAAFVLGDHRFAVAAGEVRPGPVALAVAPGDVVLTLHDPRPTSAALTVPGRVLGHESGGDLRVEVAGQTLQLPLSADSALNPTDSGASVWLSATRVWLRPL